MSSATLSAPHEEFSKPSSDDNPPKIYHRFDKYIIPHSEPSGLRRGFPAFEQYQDIASSARDCHEVLKGLRLAPAARDTVILAVAAHYRATSEIERQSQRCIKERTLTIPQMASIIKGERPTELDASSSAAYDAALYLVSTPGSLPDPLWANCVSFIGKQGAIEVVHFVGMYIGACVLVNAMGY